MEGLLSNVHVKVYDADGLIHEQTTDANGELKLTLPLNEVFFLELSKEGYEKNILQIDTRNMPKTKPGMSPAFTSAEFMLNSYVPKEKAEQDTVGKLYFDEKEGAFEFTAGLKKGKTAGNSVELIRKAIVKNKTFSSPASYAMLSASSFPDSSRVNFPKTQSFGLLPTGIKNISQADISLRKNEIEREKSQLEKDKLHALSMKDNLIINARAAVIHASEVELQNAFTLIQSQQSDLRHKKRELYVTLAGLLLLAGSLVILFFYYREKRRTNLILETQNRNILDSITYAKRIQQSILIDEGEIRRSLPDFFIYNQPKDIVSGDFYWFSEIEDKVILAVVDCTGHGVTGAFMSLIANTLLNEIVNEKHITNPALILKYLHLSITNVLHQEKENSTSYDGMDMALCVIDKSKNKIRYAGAINPLYVVHDNTVNVIKGDIQSIGGRRLSATKSNLRKFKSHTLTIKEGMSFYLFSDGYVDQFGGESKKKFGTERFRQLLLDIHTKDMSWQKEIIQQTIQEWRGSYKQIDDMLVLGMKA